MLSLYLRTDPGHGWLGVPETIIDLLDITVSPHSFYDAERALYWLEEDVDFGRFLVAMGEAGLKFNMTRNDGEHNRVIRRLGNKPRAGRYPEMADVFEAVEGLNISEIINETH